MANANLTKAKNEKNDEFYTQYHDIEREMNAYLDYDPDVFRGKTVLLPCDDPEWSNFTRYFVFNFDRLGLKKLISTSYAPRAKGPAIDLFSYAAGEAERTSPQFDAEHSVSRGRLLVLDGDHNGDKAIDMKDVRWTYLEGHGDFRSAEVTALRDEADIIITNPPFSLFREYMAWILQAPTQKRFVTIANKNCITYKEIFPLIKDNLMWSGRQEWSGGMWFRTTDPEMADKNVDGIPMRNVASIWLTNIDHGRRHQPIPLDTMANNLRHNKKMKGKAAYDRYDNYDAIDVPFTNAIPSDYDGVMGVPISFLDKYCPEQFGILGMTSTSKYDDSIIGIPMLQNGSAMPIINSEKQYARIFIRHVK